MTTAAAADVPLDRRQETRVRRTVAVLLSRFPLVTETFILREVEEMERQGQPVLLVPLIRERPAVAHRQARRWVERALYTPWLSLPLLAANLRALRHRPARYLETLVSVLRGTVSSPHMLARTALLFPKAVYLAEVLRRRQIDHVHAHFATHPATVALVVSRLAGIGFSFTAHAHDIFVRQNLLREKLQQATFVRVISEYNREFLSRRWPELAHKVTVIHTGVEEDRLRSRPRAEVDESRPARLLCVAALKPYKGHEVLLDALALLRAEGVELECELVGDGPLRQRLEREVARRQLTSVVSLLGAREQDDVRRLIEEAAIVVLPSVVAADGQMEGIPVVLMEAMAAGRPVVASRLSGIPELVEDERDGLLVPPGDAPALAAAVCRLLADSSLAQRLASRAPAKVERGFRLDRCVAALVERLEGSRPPPPRFILDALPPLPEGGPIGVEAVSSGRDSDVAELVLYHGASAAPAVLKRHASRPGANGSAAARARREAELLERIGRELGAVDPGAAGRCYAVPTLLSVNESRASLLMTRCPGRRLDELVRSLRLHPDGESRAALRRAVAASGEWLRRFQLGVQAPAGRVDAVAVLVGAAESDLRRCLELSSRERDTISRRLDALGSEVQRRAPSACVRHGDFWPGNLFVAEDRVEAIDFEGFGKGLRHEDAATFLVHLSCFFALPLLRARLPPLVGAFLDGFRRDGGPVGEDAEWRLCLLAAALRHGGRGEEREASDRSWQVSWRRRTLRRILAETGPLFP